MLKLFVREACHLCEEAAELIEAQQRSVERIDIDEELELGVRYGLRIPVLQSHTEHGLAELDWPFDAVSLAQWLKLHAPAP